MAKARREGFLLPTILLRITLHAKITIRAGTCHGAVYLPFSKNPPLIEVYLFQSTLQVGLSSLMHPFQPALASGGE